MFAMEQPQLIKFLLKTLDIEFRCGMMGAELMYGA
jgi:hypothetical protein